MKTITIKDSGNGFFFEYEDIEEDIRVMDVGFMYTAEELAALIHDKFGDSE